MFFLVGISISFFLSFLLLTKRNKSVADWILAAWIGIAGIHLLLFYLFISGKVYSEPWLLGMERPMPLLHGPFLFLYASALTSRLSSRKWINWLHFIPVLVSYACMLQFFVLPTVDRIWVYQHQGVGYEKFSLVNQIAIYISGVVYAIATSILLREHRRSILHQFSNTDKINLLWLQYLTYGIALIWMVVLTSFDEGVFMAVVLFIIFIGYFGTMQAGIFVRTGSPVGRPPDSASPEKKKYEKSGLNTESAEVLYQKLMKLVGDEKVYRNGELTLVDLAERMGTHPNYLSQVINERTGRNFYEFVNYLRVEEFIRLAADPSNQKFTLVALAADCGFNSKSAFNRSFKRVTGKAPREYLVSKR